MRHILKQQVDLANTIIESYTRETVLFSAMRPNKYWLRCTQTLKSCRHAEIVSILLDHGADPNHVSSKGETPISIARLPFQHSIRHREWIHSYSHEYPSTFDHLVNFKLEAAKKSDTTIDIDGHKGLTTLEVMLAKLDTNPSHSQVTEAVETFVITTNALGPHQNQDISIDAPEDMTKIAHSFIELIIRRLFGTDLEYRSLGLRIILSPFFILVVSIFLFAFGQ